MCCRSGLPLPGSIPLGWDSKSLGASTERHSTSLFPICWGHQDMESGPISRLNTLYVQLTGILWRAVLIFSLLKTSLSHWTGIPFGCPAGSYLFLPTFQKEKGQGRGHTLKLQSAWDSLWKRFNLAVFVLIWAHLGLPMMGRVKPQLFCLSSWGWLEETKALFSKPAAEDTIQKPLCWLHAIWSPGYMYINTFMLLDALPQPDRKHLCFMVCNSSSVSRQKQWME